jgi:hypothetical protein
VASAPPPPPRPGWYPDPEASKAQRYFDGTNWTNKWSDPKKLANTDYLAKPSSSSSLSWHKFSSPTGPVLRHRRTGESASATSTSSSATSSPIDQCAVTSGRIA